MFYALYVALRVAEKITRSEKIIIVPVFLQNSKQEMSITFNLVRSENAASQ